MSCLYLLFVKDVFKEQAVFYLKTKCGCVCENRRRPGEWHWSGEQRKRLSLRVWAGRRKRKVQACICCFRISLTEEDTGRSLLFLIFCPRWVPWSLVSVSPGLRSSSCSCSYSLRNKSFLHLLIWVGGFPRWCHIWRHSISQQWQCESPNAAGEPPGEPHHIERGQEAKEQSRGRGR